MGNRALNASAFGGGLMEGVRVGAAVGNSISRTKLNKQALDQNQRLMDRQEKKWNKEEAMTAEKGELAAIFMTSKRLDDIDDGQTIEWSEPIPQSMEMQLPKGATVKYVERSGENFNIYDPDKRKIGSLPVEQVKFWEERSKWTLENFFNVKPKSKDSDSDKGYSHVVRPVYNKEGKKIGEIHGKQNKDTGEITWDKKDTSRIAENDYKKNYAKDQNGIINRFLSVIRRGKLSADKIALYDADWEKTGRPLEEAPHRKAMKIAQEKIKDTGKRGISTGEEDSRAPRQLDMPNPFTNQHQQDTAQGRGISMGAETAQPAQQHQAQTMTREAFIQAFTAEQGYSPSEEMIEYAKTQGVWQ